MTPNAKKITLLIFLLTTLNACQFSSMFHRAIKNPNTNFNKLNGYTINDTTYFTVAHDTLKSTVSIYKDSIKLNTSHEIKPITIQSKSGNSLSGLILTPNNNTREDLVFVHFHGSAKNLIGYHYPMISQLVDKGFQVVTFDYSGYGFSDGKATRKNVLMDAYSALEYVKNNKAFANKKIILFGQSYGGYLAAVVGSNKQNDIKGMVIEGAFYSHRKEAVHVAGFAANLVYDGIRAEKEIKLNKKPILIIHSNEDNMNPIKFGKKIYEEANEPKYFMEIDKWHLGGLQYYGDSIKNKINEIFR